MKKFLVPTDFSATAKNAARYAVQLASNVAGSTIILYNIYDKLAVGSDGSPLTESDDDRKIVLNQALANLEIELHELANVDISYVAEEGSSLVENVDRYVRHNGIDIVIMGITGATQLEQIFVGSNAINMARQGSCPVIIVPPNGRFKEVKNVLLASDFKNVSTTTPFAQIKGVLDIFKPQLHIVNVDSEHYVELTQEYKQERAKLESQFQAYNPEFYFIRLYDFLDAISNFTVDKNIDLIITVPKKQSFLTSLFKTSNTKKLAYHSYVPIVAIHA
ncbi:MAG TPA: universal stress protein [Flavitalea sp.]|nr:universal stress protein [Flavitalea sp.]